MFELHNSFDLLVSISHFIYSYRQTVGTSGSLEIKPKIINQERGGVIIFVWNDIDKDKPSIAVTNFGVYELDTQKYTVIYTYEQAVKVVSCSVNPERTLLAFSTVTSNEVPGEKKPKDVYQAYLAELQSVDKTVFSLNMERPTFLKVQFLYPDQQRSATTHSKDSEMLVFLHKESIGLYRVSLGRIGDKGIIMSGQPKTEQVVRKFVWCQWDSGQQRLHYIENVRVGSDQQQASQKMSSIQFTSNGHFENMMDVPISFPFPYIRTADKSHYGDIPLHPGIPEVTLNAAVLTQPTGAFCLCYHKQTSAPKHRPTQGPEKYVDVEYYVSMIHHAKTLYGCVSHIPRDAAVQKRLVFSWLGHYLVVMMPGLFLHLLNVSPSYEPCHHILLHDPQLLESFGPSQIFVSPEADKTQPSGSPTPSVIPVFSQHTMAMKTLLPCQSFVRESGSLGQQLYDYRSGCLMKLVLNLNSLVDTFRGVYWQTQLAIFHFLVLQNKNVATIRALLEVVTEDISSFDVHSLFAEYLVASTFAEMKKQVNKDIQALLPFTYTQTLRGQVEKTSSGHRQAHISYSPLETLNLSKKWKAEQKSSSREDLWDNLFRRLKLVYSQNIKKVQKATRFSHEVILSTYRQTEMQEAAGKVMWNAMHVEDSFFDGVFNLKTHEKSKVSNKSPDQDFNTTESGAGSGHSKLDGVLGPAPLFLQVRSPHSTLFKRRLSVLTKELLTQHLTKFLSRESQPKIKNVASEYLFCQVKVSRQLCHLIWSLRGQHVSSCQENFLPRLQYPGQEKEYELFQLYERFYLTVGDLGFPVPPGFISFFTSLGFKVLNFHLFVQYVDRNILTLTPDFIHQLLEDLPDSGDPEVPLIKFQLISRLPKAIAEEFFEHWNHPIIQQRKAKEQVAQILLPGNQASTIQSSSYEGGRPRGSRQDSSSGSSFKFPPLDAFMQHLDGLVSGLRPLHPISLDTNTIEDTALFYTKTKTNLDLSTVNF